MDNGNRALFVAIRELPPPDRCACFARMSQGTFETAEMAVLGPESRDAANSKKPSSNNNAWHVKRAWHTPLQAGRSAVPFTGIDAACRDLCVMLKAVADVLPVHQVLGMDHVRSGLPAHRRAGRVIVLTDANHAGDLAVQPILSRYPLSRMPFSAVSTCSSGNR